jgi:putative hemolysin
MNDVERIALVLALIVATGFFTLAEYALVTTRRWRMQELARDGDRRAAAVLGLMKQPLRFIATIELGISALSILVGALGEPVLRRLFDPPLSTGVSFAIGIAAMTFLSVLIADLVPKAIALQRAERLSLQLAPTIAALARFCSPVVWLLQVASAGLLRPFGLRPPRTQTVALSERDLRGILGEAEEHGVIEEAEEEMIYNVFDFAAAEARKVMIPRAQVAALSAALTVQRALTQVLDAPYVCHPVYDGDLDHIIGVLYLRDLFTAAHRGAAPNVSIAELMRPAHFVPETKDLGALLAEFRLSRSRLAIVLDEHGATAGIVTLEDLLEELVGEIAAEYELPDETVHLVDDDTVEVSGTFPIDDFSTRFGVALPSTRFHTLAGLTFDQLGRVAVVGDELPFADVRLQVVEVDGPRIRRLEAHFPHAHREGRRDGAEAPQPPPSRIL